jgi:hypothetical protein
VCFSFNLKVAKGNDVSPNEYRWRDVVRDLHFFQRKKSWLLFTKLFHKNTVVSKFLSETTMCPQTFIAKILIIENMHSHHIYMKQKEGASGQDSGERERERVRVPE